jgi:hypothetical protein
MMVYPYCLECRGMRDLCRKGSCELLRAVRARLPEVMPIGRVIEGPSPPDVFVGHIGYPKVGVGPLVPPIEATGGSTILASIPDMVDAPIEDVVAARSLLYHTRQRTIVHTRRELPRLMEMAQEVAMSARPVETEVELTRPPPSRQRINLDPFAPPMGPGVEAERGRIVGQPVVPRKVDQLVSDGDASAVTAATEMYRSGVGEDHIHRLMSVGLLGRTTSRRMVPTRWSITAVDDTLSKELAVEVKGMQELGEHLLYSGVLKGNHFHILLVPRPWSFEMVEAWVRGSLWTADTTVISDSEGPEGRKDYARNVTGAYYAARLAVLEHMKGMQRQGTAVVYREVTEEYWAPLGVWVIREGVRAALRERPEVLGDLPEGVRTVSSKVRVDHWYRHSELIDEALTQRRLEDYGAIG